MTREEEGVGTLNECDRKRDLTRKLALLHAKADEYRRNLALAAEYLAPHATFSEPEFGETKTAFLQFGNSHLPTLDEMNDLIGEIGKTRQDLFNVNERLKRILGLEGVDGS